MDGPFRILVVEDMPTDAELTEREIAQVLGACEFRQVETRDEFVSELSSFDPHLVVSDFTLPQFSGLEALRLAGQHAPGTPVIIVTHSVNEETAVACMKAGAADYVIKGHLKRLGRAVERAIEERRTARARAEAEAALHIKDYALDSAMSGILLADLDGRIIYVNDAYCRLWGLRDRHAIVGRRFGEFRAHMELIGTIEAALREGRSFSGEGDGITADGAPIQIQVSASPVRDHDGRPVCSMAAFNDVTERKQVERQLAAWKRRYELFAEASRLVPYDRCGSTDIVEWSASVESVLGTPAASMGTQMAVWRERIHPEDRVRALAAFSDAERTGAPLDIEYRFRHGDGRYLHIHDRGFPSTDLTTGDRHYIGVMSDVTETKRKDDLRRLLAHTMESVSEIATITDLDDRLTFVNDAFTRVYGYAPEEVLGRSIGMVWSLRNPPRLLGEILQTSKTGSWRGEVWNVRKDGTHFPLSLRTSQVRDDQGRVVGLLGISEDITDRRMLETQLLQAQKMDAIGRLAGGIAHDFNNATAVVLGFAELMLSDLHDMDPMRASVEAILQAARKSANLTRQLLAFARKQVVAPVVVNPNEVLANMTRMLSRLVGEDIQLVIEPAEGVRNIRIDPTQLEQILANLATNARDAIENVGTITVRTSNVDIDAAHQRHDLALPSGHYVELQFSDTGVGMDEDTQARAFEPFFTTKEVGQGTGLGLSTVFGIVQQNQGAISVRSVPGEGTTFCLYFPAVDAAAVHQKEDSAAEPARGGTETILVVEDEDQLLDLARIALRGLGYKVLTARSSGDALLLSEQHQGEIHLLLTDVVLPGMNGRQLRDRVESGRPGIKCIFMSGYTADIVSSRGVAERGDLFLQKPFTPAALAVAVRRILDA